MMERIAKIPEAEPAAPAATQESLVALASQLAGQSAKQVLFILVILVR
jgi:hypothetical protein